MTVKYKNGMIAIILKYTKDGIVTKTKDSKEFS